MFSIREQPFTVDPMKTRFYLDVTKSQEEHLYTIEFALDVHCELRKFLGEYWGPSVIINYHTCRLSHIADLLGIVVEVKSVEEADGREDMFYVFEHELIREYKLQIVSYEKGAFHVRCQGRADIGWNDEFGENVPFRFDCDAKVLKPSINGIEYDMNYIMSL